MNEYLFKDKKILVMGLGRFGGGVDVVKFACQKGAKVVVTDLAERKSLADSIAQIKGLDVDYHLGSHEPSDFQMADIVIANPAVPLNNKFLQIARDAGKQVTSQIGLFFELCPATIVGITGSNGKSTTSALTAHLLRSQFPQNVWLSGNIGNEPFLTILDKISPDDIVVLEISSFQIEQLDQSRLSPDIALLTNLTPNHLDRYGSFENYCAAKELLFLNQKPDEENPSISIFNAEDPVGSRWFDKYSELPGRTCIKFSADDVPDSICSVFSLPGRANLSNLAAALAIIEQFGISDIESSLPSFKALPHRLERVAESNGVRWFNDSKATTPDSAIVSLEAFTQPIILIAGGYDKHIPFTQLGEKVAQKAKAAILIGQTAQVIAKAISVCTDATEIIFAETLAGAVKIAHELAVPGDVVLLSPACASYDMFENYEQRGQMFSDLAAQFSQ